MKIAIITFLICFTGTLANAQSDTVYRQLPVTKHNTPFILIDSSIIVSSFDFIDPNNFDFIDPKNIKSVHIMKERASVPANLKNLCKYGIVIIDLKRPIRLKTKSFNDIKAWLNVKNAVRFAIDGFLVDDERLRIETQAIAEIDILKKSNQNNLITDIINIWTLVPDARKDYVPWPVPTGKNTTPLGQMTIR